MCCYNCKLSSNLCFNGMSCSGSDVMCFVCLAENRWSGRNISAIRLSVRSWNCLSKNKCCFSLMSYPVL